MVFALFRQVFKNFNQTRFKWDSPHFIFNTFGIGRSFFSANFLQVLSQILVESLPFATESLCFSKDKWFPTLSIAGSIHSCLLFPHKSSLTPSPSNSSLSIAGPSFYHFAILLHFLHQQRPFNFGFLLRSGLGILYNVRDNFTRLIHLLSK